MPLSPSQTADPIIYPIQLQVSAKAYKKIWDASNRFTVKNSDLGQVWTYSRAGDFTHLTPVEGEETVDGLIAARNDAPQKVDFGLAKNGSTLVVQRGVAFRDQANFKLTPKLYFMYNSNLIEGDLIKSDQSSQNHVEVDLTNLSSIDVSIETADPETCFVDCDYRDKQQRRYDEAAIPVKYFLLVQ